MKNLLIAVLILALLAPYCVAAELPDAPSATAQSMSARAANFAASQKNAIIVLKDGSKVSGKVLSSTNTNLVLSESKTGQNRTIQYDQVKELKRKGLHPAAKIAIAVGAGILGTGIVLASQMD